MIPELSRPIDLSPSSDKDLGLSAAPTFLPRLLFVSSSSGNGGADRLPVELASGLAERGASVVFACREGKFTEEQCRLAGIDTVPFNIRNSGDLAAARQLSRLIVRRSIDVMHVHARRDFMVAVLAGGMARGPRRALGAPRPRIVLHTHLLRLLGEPPLLAGRFFQSGVDAVIAVSEAVETFLQTRHGLRPGFVRRVLNGVDLDAYATPQTVQAQLWRHGLRKEWGIPDNVPVLGMVGRLHQKGQTFLLAVAPYLLSRFPDLRIVLVGPERDPEDIRRLHGRATQMGIPTDRLVIAGVRSDIPACMAAFDILAHLPRDEAFGLVLAEAMASGIPVVASAAGGCREVIADGRTGMLVPLNDAPALINALAFLLDPVSGAARRAALGAEARRAALEFSRTRQIDHLLDLYKDLCLPAA